MKKTFLLLSLLSIFPAEAHPPPSYQLNHDWLLEPSAFPASIRVTDEAIVLDNGLIRREIDLRLGTTTAFLSHMTGESIIRAVEPELSFTLNGQNFSAGAVIGQANHAYIADGEIARMHPVPGTMRLRGHHIGPIEERLQWKRVRHHAPDALWPPVGKYLRLDYEFTSLPDLSPARVENDHIGRDILFEDDFTNLRDDWKIHLSKSDPRCSFVNEGKAGEIFTFPHTAVFAERPLPKGTETVEAEINPGTDISSSWGPGIGLVYSSGRVIKFNIVPGGIQDVSQPLLGIWEGGREIHRVNGKVPVDLAKAWRLRLRMDGGRLHFDARPSDGAWREFHAMAVPADYGHPVSFRVGKLAKDGGRADYGDGTEAGKKDLIRVKVENVCFYGPRKADASADPSSTPSAGLEISVHYEIYDGLPLISKWFTLANKGPAAVNLDRFVAERLAVVEYDNPVENPIRLLPPQILHVETDMAFGGFDASHAARWTVYWEPDPKFTTQVNYARQSPCLLQTRSHRGPDQTIAPGERFSSFRTYELVQDSGDRERRSLAQRRMYRTLAPWVTENPLMFHLLSSNPARVRTAIDEAAEVGFETVILSFGSGFNAENDSPDYRAEWKKVNDYALSKGVHLGAYSLYSSRRAGGGNDSVTPPGEKPAFGSNPAVTSEWGQNYLRKLRSLFDDTGFLVFEHDGPYPGDADVTARPPLQKGLNDSQWVHWKIWSDFYKDLRARGVFMNLPDFYYLVGANKCGMGYREVNWSLPRPQQLIHTRQNIYDGSWLKTPSMGWMFIPLANYHGGGDAARIEPLSQHIAHYRSIIYCNLAFGVQACFRGPRLFDGPETKAMVKEAVDWFKKNRDILESDLIHGRRADGRDLDWMLHVNPHLETKALLAVFNPTPREITREILVPLYYSGLRDIAVVEVEGGQGAWKMELDRFQRARVKITVPAGSHRFVHFR